MTTGIHWIDSELRKGAPGVNLDPKPDLLPILLAEHGKKNNEAATSLTHLIQTSCFVQSFRFGVPDRFH